MAILDSKNLFADEVAITATATLPDDLYVGFNAGDSQYMNLSVNIDEDFNNVTSLSFTVQDSATDGTGFATLMTSRAFPLAELKAGSVLHIGSIPRKNKPYLRVIATVTGTAPTAGKITCGVIATNQTNQTF